MYTNREAIAIAGKINPTRGTSKEGRYAAVITKIFWNFFYREQIFATNLTNTTW